MLGFRMDWRMQVNALCVVAMIATSGSAVGQDEVVVPDSPTLDEVKKPFAKADPNSAKGLAARIRQQEVDAKNRILAAQYLGTLDCQRFPEAQEKLIGLMQEDPFEAVRYEAVMSLRMTLMRGMRPDQDCNDCPCDECKARRKELEQAREETEKHAAKAKRALKPKPSGLFGFVKAIPKALVAPLAAPKRWIQNKKFGMPEEQRSDYRKRCCNDNVLNALSSIAFETNKQGCPLEPSMRVREAARSALMLCPRCPGVACPDESPTIPPTPGGELNEKKPTEAKEGAAAAARDKTTSSAQPTITLASFVNEKHPPIRALRDFCVVGLKQRQFNKVRPQIRTVYSGRTYFFATLNAKAKFVQNPESFALAYCGMDPVVYVKTGEIVEGTYLREFKNRFYLFSTKENWSEFLDQADELAVPTKSSKTIARK